MVETQSMQPPSEARELERRQSPAPVPQALAFENGMLWLGSFETRKLYALNPETFAVVESANAPGRPIGMTAVNDELRLICSEVDDHRYIRRYLPGHGFMMNEGVMCPDDTGSFLAFDGLHLWLSQRYNQRVLELDAQYRIKDELTIDAQIVGLLWSGAGLYVSTWHGKEGGCMIGRIGAAAKRVEYVATLPFAAISLAHDGSKFWTNDTRANQIVAFALPRDSAG